MGEVDESPTLKKKVYVVVVVVGGGGGGGGGGVGGGGSGFCCVLCDVFRVLTVCVHSQTPSFQPLNDSFTDSIYQ